MNKKYIDSLPTEEEILAEEDLEMQGEFYKEVTLYWNGKQFVIGIPKKLEKLLEIRSGDKFAFDIKMDLKDTRKDELKFKIIMSKKDAKKKKGDN